MCRQGNSPVPEDLGAEYVANKEHPHSERPTSPSLMLFIRAHVACMIIIRACPFRDVAHGIYTIHTPHIYSLSTHCSAMKYEHAHTHTHSVVTSVITVPHNNCFFLPFSLFQIGVL